MGVNGNDVWSNSIVLSRSKSQRQKAQTGEAAAESVDVGEPDMFG